MKGKYYIKEQFFKYLENKLLINMMATSSEFMLNNQTTRNYFQDKKMHEDTFFCAYF